MLSIFHEETPWNGDYITTFYFHCDICGANGRNWTGPKPALEEGLQHIYHNH